MWGLLGYLFPAELGGRLEFGGFEAWQSALQPLLWPCGGFCVRERRVLGLLVYLFPAELGGRFPESAFLVNLVFLRIYFS